MPFSEKEMREDLHRVRVRQHILFFGGLGILGLAIALFVIFLARKDLPALILSLVGFFWMAVLLQQASRTKGLACSISARMRPENGPGGASGGAGGDGKAGRPGGDESPAGKADGPAGEREERPRPGGEAEEGGGP